MKAMKSTQRRATILTATKVTKAMKVKTVTKKKDDHEYLYLDTKGIPEMWIEAYVDKGDGGKTTKTKTKTTKTIQFTHPLKIKTWKPWITTN